MNRRGWVRVGAVILLLCLAIAPVEHAAEQPPVIGNINTKKFHRPTCRHASCPNCKAKFANREEALAAGFSPCGVCDP